MINKNGYIDSVYRFLLIVSKIRMQHCGTSGVPAANANTNLNILRHYTNLFTTIRQLSPQPGFPPFSPFPHLPALF